MDKNSFLMQMKPKQPISALFSKAFSSTQAHAVETITCHLPFTQSQILASSYRESTALTLHSQSHLQSPKLQLLHLILNRVPGRDTQSLYEAEINLEQEDITATNHTIQAR